MPLRIVIAGRLSATTSRVTANQVQRTSLNKQKTLLAAARQGQRRAQHVNPREEAMAQFRAGKIRILVCTDAAGMVSLNL